MHVRPEYLTMAAFVAVAASALFRNYVPETPPGVMGVDLGTSFSTAAIFFNGSARVIVDERGRHLVPSYVGLAKSGKLVAGYDALAQATEFPGSVVYDTKRFIGRGLEEVNAMADLRNYPFELMDVNGTTFVKLVRDKIYTTLAPEQVGAVIISLLKERAERSIGKPVTNAVLAVPVEFGERERNITARAGALAGINVLQMITEPTAAAMAYGLLRQPGQNKVLVFDFGGGTLDVSLLQLTDGIFEAVSVCGDDKLGGEDFNEYVMKQLMEEVRQSAGRDMSGIDLERLRIAVERAKITLSDSHSSTLSFPLSDGGEYRRELTREEFERLCGPIFDRMIEIVKLVLLNSDNELDSVDHIVLVGGSTRVPRVRSALEEYLKIDAKFSVDPEQAVAIGTAIQAAIIMDLHSLPIAAVETPPNQLRKCGKMSILSQEISD